LHQTNPGDHDALNTSQAFFSLLFEMEKKLKTSKYLETCGGVQNNTLFDGCSALLLTADAHVSYSAERNLFLIPHPVSEHDGCTRALHREAAGL